ncbi:MAG TPA: multidrug efflux SMR transporter [Acetobacteraceae bacterium]|nr:multidrug efflux SMR transporter [Acetobacteraceae bacterium]
MNSFLPYLLLLCAILCEVVATSFLKASDQFTRPIPSGMTIIGYAAAFYLLSVIVRTIPIGIVYAIWSGMGIVLISLVGWFVYGQILNLPTIAGLVLIVAGVSVVNLCSSPLPH